MEEELSEHELEERFYSMLHYVDETQTQATNLANVNSEKNDGARLLENTSCSTVRRYWRTNEAPQNKTSNVPSVNNDPGTKPKEEKDSLTSSPPSNGMSILQGPVPQNLKRTIVILEHKDRVVELASSDEDEVVEVAIPPKPTITIESSDEEEKSVPQGPPRTSAKQLTPPKTSHSDREVTASPVLSIVSSVSDEFIRSDCIALNISSQRSDNPSFDFSLHGSDLLDQTPSKKKKKKKSKDRTTSTPLNGPAQDATPTKTDELFATPKSKAKNKKNNKKSFGLPEKSVLTADIFDSDSNQSVTDTNKILNPYSATNKNVPNVDVYESDSNQSETISNNHKIQSTSNSIIIDSSESCVSLGPSQQETQKPKNDSRNNDTFIIDLTEDYVSLDETSINIEENIVVGNVTGFNESEDYNDEPAPQNNVSKFGSTKVPAILYEDLDFDNLKGKDKVCRRRKYSLTTLRAEMEKFYNESWGGEDFNHREIQKNMSRDKSLWVIDPKDRMPSGTKRKIICNYCNRTGHRDDTCRMKPPVCHMCGTAGHYEPRCPKKICVNCGSPNYMYSTMCRNCSTWGRIMCAECGQNGHPSSHCPDLWRRYHNTIDENASLEENRQIKKHYQLFCSGCTRRGHLVHACRVTLPFSGLPINSPYVSIYRPIYFSTTDKDKSPHNKQVPNRSFQQDSSITSATTPLRIDRNKRQSKSPTAHETHLNKKKNMTTETCDGRRNTKSPMNNPPQTKAPQNKETTDNQSTKELNQNTDTPQTKNTDTEKAPDFIPITSTNHDKKGQIIQDNEVSATSDVVTSARVYVTSEIIDHLKTKEGEEWLKATTKKTNITIQHSEVNPFLTITGKVADQDVFQSELRDWIKIKINKNTTKPDSEAATQEQENQSSSMNIPKNRNNVLRKLSKALDSLKQDLGEPDALYKEWSYLQNHHQHLLNQKAISPKQVSNNRDHMNEMLRKLNMVLLGQAGLADGPKHLNELYSLQERLINFRQKNISLELRKEIGQHFHCIFTAIPRDDYVDLLKKYYGANKSPAMFKKNKRQDCSFKLNSKPNQKKLTTMSLQQKNGNIERDTKGVDNIVQNKGAQEKQVLAQRLLGKLFFYHKRVLNARPVDLVLKKTQFDLARKLHSHLAMLRNSVYLSLKTIKKVRKIQKQAQSFLTKM